MSERRPRPPAAQTSPTEVADQALNAAEALLVERGLAQVTTAAVAARAGVSESTVRAHFDDPAALLDAVASRLLHRARAQAGARSPSLPGQLIGLLDSWQVSVAARPGLYRALHGLPFSRTQARLEALRGWTTTAVEEALGAHPSRHAVVDRTQAARMCVHLMDGVARSLRPEDGPQSLQDQLLPHLLRLLGADPAPVAGGSIEALRTPCLVLDKQRLVSNLERMSARARALDVCLRPHIKTAKSVDIACLAVGEGGPLTVSTLREAEHFAAHGFADLVYAVAIVPDRLDRVARLGAQGARVQLFVENLDAARAVVAHPGRFEVLVELDSGEDRTGVQDQDTLLAVARLLHGAPNTRLLGVATHGGHSYQARTVQQRVAVAEQERRVAVEAAELLRSAGMPCPVVSVGSTPTAVHARHLDGVTEARPGVYTLGDLFQAGIGSLDLDDIACSVLATVVSHRRSAQRLVIDAGGLALSKDRSTAGWPFDAGYGLLADAQSGELLEGLRVEGVHQEHGEVTGPIPWERLPVGARVRVLPNHICMTAAMYDRYHVVEGGRVGAVWPRVNGWRPLD